jgi:hypothetical protein
MPDALAYNSNMYQPAKPIKDLHECGFDFTRVGSFMKSSKVSEARAVALFANL